MHECQKLSRFTAKASQRMAKSASRPKREKRSEGAPPSWALAAAVSVRALNIRTRPRIEDLIAASSVSCDLFAIYTYVVGYPQWTTEKSRDRRHGGSQFRPGTERVVFFQLSATLGKVGWLSYYLSLFSVSLCFSYRTLAHRMPLWIEYSGLAIAVSLPCRYG